MAVFHYNPESSENISSQWYKHIQNESYIQGLSFELNASLNKQTENLQNELRSNNIRLEDTIKQNAQNIEQAVNLQTQSLEQTINRASTEQAAIIKESMNAVIGSIEGCQTTIERGFTRITQKLENLYSLMYWSSSVIIEELQISNILNKNIALLLRIPDIQKERRYYIEQGLKFFQNAKLDEELFRDALEYLLKALEIDKTDYFVKYYVGLIYLYGGKCIDVEKAAQYLIEAAKYAFIEMQPNSISTPDILAGDVNCDLELQKNNKELTKKIAVKSYYQAGIACYVQGEFKRASELAEKAYNINKEMIDAGFLLVKTSCAANNEDKAIKVIDNILQDNPYYSVQLLSDIDISSNKEIRDYFIKLRDDVINSVNERLNKVKGLKFDNDSEEIINNVTSLIEKNTYIDGVEAVNELDKLRDWQYEGLEFFFEQKNICSTFMNENDVIINSEFCLNKEDNRYLFMNLLTRKVIAGLDGQYLLIGINYDRTKLAFSDAQGTVIIWDLDLMRIVKTLKFERVKHIYISSDFKVLFIVTDSIEVIIWDIEKNIERHRLNKENDSNVGMMQKFYFEDCNKYISDSSRLKFKGNKDIYFSYMDNDIYSLGYHSEGSNFEKIDNKGIIVDDIISFHPNKKIIAFITYNKEQMYFLNICDYEQKIMIKTIELGKSFCFEPLTRKNSKFMSFSIDGNILIYLDKRKLAAWDFKTMAEIDTYPIEMYFNNVTESIIIENNKVLLISKIGFDDYSSSWATKKISAFELGIRPKRKTSNMNVIDFIIFINEFSKSKELILSKERLRREEFNNKLDIIEKTRQEEKMIIQEQGRKNRMEKERIKEAKVVYDKAKEEEDKQNNKLLFKNYKLALKLYEKALEMGYKDAKYDIDRINNNCI